ncbi:hypothetical protein D4Q76_02140 [archaeon]|nr:MAG: hypothetical protein D4Q76_02140 [archaeon]
MKKVLIFASVALFVLLAPFLLMANVALAATSTGPLVQASFSANPVTATPGNDGYIQMTLKNAGDAATGSIKLSSVSMDSNIIPSGTWIGDLSLLGAGDSVTSLFKFTVSGSTPSGLYTVTFNINYGADSTSRTINPNAIINVQTPSIMELSSINPSSLQPGDKINLTFTITNKGSSPVANAVFTWTSSGNAILPLGSGNRVLIPSIGSGADYKIPVEVSVSPSAAPGVYPLGITIQYSDKSGTNQTINSVAGIKISGETDFDVVAQDSSAGSTTLAVANIGANAGQSVIVSIPSQENFRAVGTSSSVVGNLNTGDYTLATFQLAPATRTANISSPARIPANFSSGNNENLVVEISYTDALGIRRTVQKNVMLSAAAAAGNFTGTRSATQHGATQTNGSGGLIYIIIGAGGIVAIVAFFKIRKMRKTRKSEKK